MEQKEETRKVLGIRILKEIPEIRLMKGMLVEPGYMRKTFPYIDISNEKYFEKVTETKFSKGDLVRVKKRWYADSIGVENDGIYRVTGVSIRVDGQNVSIWYTLDSTRLPLVTINVHEDDLKSAAYKYVVSFSGFALNCRKPDVHEVERVIWERKLQGKWKEMFTFDTYEEAAEVADFFGRHTIREIMETCKSRK